MSGQGDSNELASVCPHTYNIRCGARVETEGWLSGRKRRFRSSPRGSFSQLLALPGFILHFLVSPPVMLTGQSAPFRCIAARFSASSGSKMVAISPPPRWRIRLPEPGGRIRTSCIGDVRVSARPACRGGISKAGGQEGETLEESVSGYPLAAESLRLSSRSREKSLSTRRFTTPSCAFMLLGLRPRYFRMRSTGGISSAARLPVRFTSAP